MTRTDSRALAVLTALADGMMDPIDPKDGICWNLYEAEVGFGACASVTYCEQIFIGLGMAKSYPLGNTSLHRHDAWTEAFEVRYRRGGAEFGSPEPAGDRPTYMTRRELCALMAKWLKENRT